MMLRALALALVLLSGTGCSERPSVDNGTAAPDNIGTSPPTADPISQPPRQTSAVLLGFIAGGSDALNRFQQYCQQLHTATERFLTDNTEENWHALRPLWQQAHNHWHSSSFFLAAVSRRPLALASINHTLSTIHSAPITPGYLDSIDGYPLSGLVNDITVPITERAIRQQHQRFDHSEIALGLHALEFFLWHRQRQDFGSTAVSEHAADGSIQQQSEQRRRALLSLTTKLLLADSQQLIQQWAGANDYWLTQNIQQQNQLPLNGALHQLLQLNKHSDIAANRYQWQQHSMAQLQQQTTEFIAPQFDREAVATLAVLFNRIQTVLQSLDDHTKTARAETDKSAPPSEKTEKIEQWQKELRTARGLLIERLQELKTIGH